MSWTHNCPDCESIVEYERFTDETVICSACKARLVAIHDCEEEDCYDYLLPAESEIATDIQSS